MGPCRAHRREDEIRTPLSPSPLVPGAARWALTLCVLYQGPDRGPLPFPGPPKDAFQAAWGDAHDPALRPQPLAMPCTATPLGRVAVRRGEQDVDVALSSWCGEGSSHGSLCTQVCAARAAIAAVHQDTLGWGEAGA